VPSWRLRGQNLLLRVEAVIVAVGNGVRAEVVMVTATYLTLATAQKILMSRLVVPVAARADAVPVEASTLRQAPSVVEK
jgi:hypothetical protein